MATVVWKYMVGVDELWVAKRCVLGMDRVLEEVPLHRPQVPTRTRRCAAHAAHRIVQSFVV